MNEYDSKSPLGNYIAQLSYEELVALRKEVLAGRILEQVNNKIRQYDNVMQVCPVCEKAVQENKDLMLHFGPHEFRQKARFCGTDCLQFFLAEHAKKTV